jgi:parvulin-like peptidyl-prolyl isomerase
MRITATGDGIDTKGKTTGEIEKEFLGQPDDKELAAYAKKLGDELDIIRVRHVFAAFDHRRGAAYRNRAFTQEEISRAKLRAEALFDKLDKGELTFDLAVKDHSDCPSAAVGGDLGYLAASFDVVLGIPPKAYLLDYLRLPGGQRTPLATAPDPAIYEAAKMITDGEMSRPVRTATGFSVIMRDETRKLTDLDVAADYLRRRWLSRKRAEIIAKARNDGQVKILWSPSRRHQISGSGSGNWVESR